jgi:hypothetical protein
MTKGKRTIIKHRLVAYKLLTALLYHRHLPEIIQPSADNKQLLIVKVGALARYNRISTSRCKDQLTWLQSLGFIKDLEITRYEATLTMRMPGDDWV